MKLSQACLCASLFLLASPSVSRAQFSESWSSNNSSLGTNSLVPNNLGDLDGDSQPELVLNHFNGSNNAVQIVNPITGAVKFTSTTTTTAVWTFYILDMNFNGTYDHVLAVAQAGPGSPPTVLVIGGGNSLSAPGNGTQGMLDKLLPARPNPFGGQLALSYSLAAPARAELEVYDVAGRLVRRLGGDRVAAGEHRVDWDGRDQAGHALEAGMYYYRLNVDGRASEARNAVRLGQ